MKQVKINDLERSVEKFKAVLENPPVRTADQEAKIRALINELTGKGEGFSAILVSRKK